MAAMDGRKKCPHEKLRYASPTARRVRTAMAPKRQCVQCSGCPHWQVEEELHGVLPLSSGKLRRNCARCVGCPHGKVKYECQACKTVKALMGLFPTRARASAKNSFGKNQARLRRVQPVRARRTERLCAVCAGRGSGGSIWKVNCSVCNGCKHGKVKQQLRGNPTCRRTANEAPLRVLQRTRGAGNGSAAANGRRVRRTTEHDCDARRTLRRS